jgi:anti-anti-sigma regulatory factor
MAIKNSSADIVTVDLHPEPDTGTELATVASLVRLRGDCDVAVDFSRVDIVTSASLSKLLELRKLLANCAHRLVLFGLAPETRNTFKEADLDVVFQFADDKSAALAAIRGTKQPKSKVRTPVMT